MQTAVTPRTPYSLAADSSFFQTAYLSFLLIRSTAYSIPKPRKITPICCRSLIYDTTRRTLVLPSATREKRVLLYLLSFFQDRLLLIPFQSLCRLMRLLRKRIPILKRETTPLFLDSGLVIYSPPMKVLDPTLSPCSFNALLWAPGTARGGCSTSPPLVYESCEGRGTQPSLAKRTKLSAQTKQRGACTLSVLWCP